MSQLDGPLRRVTKCVHILAGTSSLLKLNTSSETQLNFPLMILSLTLFFHSHIFSKFDSNSSLYNVYQRKEENN